MALCPVCKRQTLYGLQKICIPCATRREEASSDYRPYNSGTQLEDVIDAVYIAGSIIDSSDESPQSNDTTTSSYDTSSMSYDSSSSSSDSGSSSSN